MLAKLNTFALVGIDAVPVVAEVDASPGLPKTILVVLPERAVRRRALRGGAALVTLGYERHPGRTVINLAPARFRRESPGADPASSLRRPTCEPAERAASPGVASGKRKQDRWASLSCFRHPVGPPGGSVRPQQEPIRYAAAVDDLVLAGRPARRGPADLCDEILPRGTALYLLTARGGENAGTICQPGRGPPCLVPAWSRPACTGWRLRAALPTCFQDDGRNVVSRGAL